MRTTVRRFSQVAPEERLAGAIRGLPRSAQRALRDVADRDDLPLVAGDWGGDSGGCLVANVVRAFAAPDDRNLTLDLRVLELFPELSSRDLNQLIVAWDEAAAQEGRASDPALRRLLRGALARALGPEATPGAASGLDMATDDPALDTLDRGVADADPVVARAPLGVPSRV
jgi:hypothetical protein